MNPVFNQEKIQQVAQGEVFIFEAVESTNEFLLNRYSTLNSGSVCIAESQTAGRGRRGRTWYSPQSDNLYFSLLWRYPNAQVADLSALSLVVAMVIAESLTAQQIPDIQIKWPNDIYFRGKKAGGILIESRCDNSGFYLVIGIGLNLGMSNVDTDIVNQPWADFAEFQLDRTACAIDLIDGLQTVLAHYPQTGFAPFATQWQRWDFFKSTPVNLLLENETISGIAQGVNSKGELLLLQEDKIHTFAIGEISVRKNEGN